MDLNPENFKKLPALLIEFLQLVISVYKKFIDDAGFARAGGLAFSSLLAAVPFATLIISLMSAFGALDSVQNQIMDAIVQFLIPTRQAEIKIMLERFLENSSALGGVGIVFFTITSIMLLNTVTDNLNAICGNLGKANFISKFTTYASVIIFGSLLLAASTTLTSSVRLTHIENIAFLNRALLKMAPFVIDFFVILLLIGLVPSARIKFKYLLPVSIIGAIFWEFLKYGFFNLSSWALRMSVIYGTIAVIPIFLFWIYIIWIIIICTLETAWLLQNKNSAWQGKPLTAMLPGEQLAFGFALFMEIAGAFDRGETPPGNEALSRRFSVPVKDVYDMTSRLSSEGMLMHAGENGKSWVPSRSLSKIRTDDLIEVIYGKDVAAVAPEKIQSFYSNGVKAVAESSITDLLNEGND